MAELNKVLFQAQISNIQEIHGHRWGIPVLSHNLTTPHHHHKNTLTTDISITTTKNTISFQEEDDDLSDDPELTVKDTNDREDDNTINT